MNWSPPSSVGWSWPRGNAIRYCIKVSIATLLGYALSLGDVTYAVYGAFTAALVVGTSRGEDIGSAANRARGSIVGMFVGIAASHWAPHPAIAVALGIGVTSYVSMGCGWGQAAARVGASLCAVTILAHSQDALEYSAMRMLNTLIGIAAGLVVSYFVLPIRGRDLLAKNMKDALTAVGNLLTALSRFDPPPGRAQYFAVFDAMVAMEKTLIDARKEIGGDFEALREPARQVALVCLGALSAALARTELTGRLGELAGATTLLQEAAALADRAKTRSPVPRTPADEVAQHRVDEAALHGFALGLRKIDHALRALGH